MINNKDNRSKIGEMIAVLREHKGISIRQLSLLSGVSASNISKIEHGRYNVSIDILTKITDALGAEIFIK